MIAEIESNSNNKELLARVKSLDKNINGFGTVLHRFISNYDNGSNAVFWDPQDVVSRAKGKNIEITRKQAISIIKKVTDSYKPDKGITWADIDIHLNTFQN